MAKKKKNGKRGKKNESWKGVVPVVVIILLVAAVAVLVMQQPDDEVVQASYAETLAAFRARGVSEVILPDLATDFSSGNYTISELAEKYPGFEEDIRAVSEQLEASNEEVVAVINGQPITRTQLDGQRALLPPQFQQLLTDDQILEQMINEELILQEGARLGLSVSAEEAEDAYQNLLASGGLSEEQLLENLASYGLAKGDLEVLLERQLLIAKTVDERVAVPEVSDEAVAAFYEANKDSFRTEAEVTVKHILIPTGEGALETAEEALARYEAGEDFCDLVTEYSKDLGSKETCGEYSFGRGFMVPEFEEASFRLADGETEIVETQFGQHVVLKVSSAEGEDVPFAEVEGSIRGQLEGDARNAAYQAFLDRLRSEAEIENAFVAPITGAAVTAEEPVLEEVEVIAEGELEEVEDLLEEAEESIEEIVEEPVEEPVVEEPVVEEPIEEPVEEIIEETVEEPIVEEPVVEPVIEEPVEEVFGADLEGFVECLSQNDAVLYYASWSTVSNDELKKFMPYVKKLARVDCTEQINVPACLNHGVEAYPTWIVGGTSYPGQLSFDELASFTGCTAPN